jgi:hypothetical protein
MPERLGYLDILRGPNCARGAALILISVWSFAANAAPPAGYDPNSAESKWYEGARSESGTFCCSMADGHVAQSRYIGTPPDGHWEVMVRGTWREVLPSEILRKGYPPHPAGSAVVWESSLADQPVRCFSPPTSGN